MTTQGADKDQQDQTREFFESYAQEWQRQAVSPTSYDLIAARNGAVIHVLAGMKGAKRLLDVGCGTGQLVIDAAARGIHAVGIDFAADMIAHCEANRKQAGVDAEFIVGSFFDMPNPAQPFDLISAQGFIEYISPEQTEAFFRKARTMLSPQGALVVGSRNRLFNVVSLNDYTKAELELGTFADLVGEALAFQTSSQAEAFDALRNFERIAKQRAGRPETESFQREVAGRPL